MAETPGRPLSSLIEDGGLVVGDVLAHVMDASTLDMPPPPPLPWLLPLPGIIPVPLPPTPLHIIPAMRSPLSHRGFLDKDLQPGHIQQARNIIVMGENVLRKIMVLNKTSMVLIHSANGSWEIPLVVSLHLDARRGRLFLAWDTSSSSSLPIISYGWNFTPPNSW